jgi:hypothetical protein
MRFIKSAGTNDVSYIAALIELNRLDIPPCTHNVLRWMWDALTSPTAYSADPALWACGVLGREFGAAQLKEALDGVRQQ